MIKLKKIFLVVAVITMACGASITVCADDEININTASKEELMQLEGVGSSYAQKIIDYREANGHFDEPEDITKVKGIGMSTYEKNKNRISVVTAEQAVSDTN